MSIHSSGRNGSFSPPIIAHDVPRGLPEQGNSPGTVTASALLPPPTLLCTQGTRTGPLGQLFPSHATCHGTVHPEDGQQVPAESLVWARTGPRQVAVMVEELVRSAVMGAWAIPPTGMTAGAVTLEADGLPAAPRFFTRSNILHTAHTPAETCLCSALHASPMHSPPPPPPPVAWQGHILPFLAGTLLFFHMLQ